VFNVNHCANGPKNQRSGNKVVEKEKREFIGSPPNDKAGACQDRELCEFLSIINW
jgi:hypothetical protein